MRLLNRLLALVLGLALAAAGLIVAVEAALAGSGRGPWLVDRGAADATLSGLSWDEPPVPLVAAIMLVAGLVLLIFELAPRAPAALTLAGSDSRRAEVARRGLQARLAATASDDADVTSAEARLRRRHVRLTAHAPPDADPAAVRARVADAVADDLTALRPARMPRVKVRVDRAGGRVR